MEAKFWTIFRPRKANQQLETGYRYESAKAGKAPVKGLLPVQGNGPSILDLYRQGKTAHDRPDRFRAVLDDNTAPSPPVAMTRDVGVSRTNSMRTLGRRLSIKSTIKAGRKIKGLTRGKSSPDLRAAAPNLLVPAAPPTPPMPILAPFLHDNNQFGEKPLPRLPSSSHFDAKKHRRKSTHIDLFDAIPAMPESLKDEAGRRNYGEDVADRNISMYGSESNRTSIDTHQTSDARVAYSSSKRLDTADWLNQPWVKEGTKPWQYEQARGKDYSYRSSGARSTRSVRSMKTQEPEATEWPIKSRNRRNTDAGDALRDPIEPDDDDDFELGAVTISDDIFYPG